MVFSDIEQARHIRWGKGGDSRSWKSSLCPTVNLLQCIYLKVFSERNIASCVLGNPKLIPMGEGGNQFKGGEGVGCSSYQRFWLKTTKQEIGMIIIVLSKASSQREPGKGWDGSPQSENLKMSPTESAMGGQC